jgi:hypothetical protein
MTVAIHKADLDSMNIAQVCEAGSDCFLTLGSTAITDMMAAPAHNYGNPILASDAKEIRVYVRDDTQVSMASFSLYLGSGEVVIVFDEPVELSAIDMTKLTFSTSRDPTEFRYVLEQGTVKGVGGPPSSTVTVTLTVTDLSAIKRQSQKTATTGAGTVCVFEQDFVLEDAIGSHACSLEDLPCV